MQTRPDLRGNLKPPTLDLFCLFRFRVPRTGHEFLLDEAVLDPHYERRMATFFLKSPPQTDFFCTRGWRGRDAWLRMRGRTGGRASAVARWRASEPWIRIGLHVYLYPCY